MKINMISDKAVRFVVPELETNHHYHLTSRKNHFIGQLLEVSEVYFLVKIIAGDDGIGELFCVDKRFFNIVGGIDLNELYYKEYNLFWGL